MTMKTTTKTGTQESQMTKTAAKRAMKNGTQVEAGVGEDHDTGVILALNGEMAEVAWQSGVRTPCPITDLEVA